MGRQSVSATITAQNQFTDWFSVRPPFPGAKQALGLRIGDNTAFTATLTLQTKAPGEAAAAAADIESYTAAQRKTLEFAEAVDVRVGCKTGNFTSGTIPISISE